jgi:hypothetical protein
MIHWGNISMSFGFGIIAIPGERDSLWTLWATMINIFFRSEHVFSNPGYNGCLELVSEFLFMIAADVTHICDSDINMQGQIPLGIADHRA